MDNLDREILTCLRENSREKASSISRKINLSVSAVLERIHKLEQSGVILGYTVITNRKMLGIGMQALMEVSLEHPKYYESFCREVSEISQVSCCYYVNGDFDFLLRVFARDAEDFEVIHTQIKNIRGVSGTKTYIALRTVKEEL